MAQVGRDRHALQLRLAGLDLQRRLVERDVQAQRRAVAAFGQRVLLDDAVGQHRDLPAGHVDGRQAVARDLVDRAVRQDRQARRGDVHAEDDRAACPGRAPTARRRSRSSASRRSRTRRTSARGRSSLIAGASSGGKPVPFGKLLEQEAAPVELVRAGDRAGGLQQVERRALRAACEASTTALYSAAFLSGRNRIL